MNSRKEKTKKLSKKDKSPKVILEFIPNPNFEEEFLEFVEKILNREENPNEKQKIEDKKDERK